MPSPLIMALSTELGDVIDLAMSGRISLLDRAARRDGDSNAP